MAVRTKNARWKMKDILRRHWLALGTRHGVIAADWQPVQTVLDDLVARPPGVLDQVRANLPTGFPVKAADSILAGVQSAAAHWPR